MPHLMLNLFGSPRVRLDGVPVEISSQKAVALLVYLTLVGRSHRRDVLATLLWPDYAQSYARAYLRQSLHELTKMLGHHWFKVSREHIGLAEEVSIQTDVGEFKRLLAGGGDEPNALRQAVALCTNEFLAGFSLPDCPEFEMWQLLETENLRRALLDALQELLRRYTEQQAYAAALEVGRRWLALDRYDEAAHRSLMKLYAWMGQPTAALRQYEECKKLLVEALQTTPDPETQALYETIRSRRLPPLPPPSLPDSKANSAPEAASNVSAVPVPPFFSGQVAATQSPTFVARERELHELSEALATARDGSGQILFVIGGAGRGKSMLVQEFARRAQSEYVDLLVASGTCNAYTGTGDPYSPFREILMTLVGDVESKVAGGFTPMQDAQRLWKAMPSILPALVQYAPDLLRAFVPIDLLQARAESFAMRNAPWLQRLRLLANGEQRLQLEERQLVTQFTDAFKAIATHHPLLLILEDLHWVDAASNSLLLHLSRTLGESRILVVGTYRPDELMGGRNLDRHPLAGIIGELKRQHGDIWLDLGALSSAEGRAFVDAYLDRQPNRLGEEFRAAVFHHTGGHALFTVELLREMQARGGLRRDTEGNWVAGETINWSVLPAKVEGVIEQRIGRLEKGLQATLAVASIEGESFTAEVVARVRGQEEFEVVQVLSQELAAQHRLVRVESLGMAGQQRLSRYRFRHHLFQQYLYNRLTESERAYLHEKVGNAIEILYAGQTAPVAVQLAYHFEQAGFAAKAVEYLRQAGERAHHISANQEAIELLSRALALLTTLPATTERDKQELVLRITLGRALLTVKGQGASVGHDTFVLAYDLCRHVGNAYQLFVVLRGLYTCNVGLKRELEITEQMLQIAEELANPVYQVSAHHCLGHTYLSLGQVVPALDHLDRCLDLYELGHLQEYLWICGQDEGVAAMANQSSALWHRGYPDQALQRGYDAIALAEKLSHPFSMAIAQHFVVLIHLLRGDTQIALQQIDLLLDLAHAQGFGYIVSVCDRYTADALLAQGQVEEAIVRYEQYSAFLLAIGNAKGQPYAQVWLAHAYGRIGQVDHALTLLNEAEPAIIEDLDVLAQARVHRIRGQLLQAQAKNVPDSRTRFMAEAEASFLNAIAITREQEAKSLELRETLALCRLWQHQGKIAEARAALAEIYGWFTEGFDTADLLDAQALLAELTAASSDAK